MTEREFGQCVDRGNECHAHICDVAVVHQVERVERECYKREGGRENMATRNHDKTRQGRCMTVSATFQLTGHNLHGFIKEQISIRKLQCMKL